MNAPTQAQVRPPRELVVERTPKQRRLTVRMLPALWPLLRVLAARDLKSRYKQAALGPAWVIFQPLALLAAFAIGFRAVAHVKTGGVPYAVFVLAGLPAWAYFQVAATASAGTILSNYSLVRWTPCPRVALPLASLGANLPSLAIPLIAGLGAALAAGYGSLRLLLLPFAILWLLAVVLSVALTLSALTVRAHDILSVLPFLIQILTFVSPIGYPSSALPHSLRVIVAINPLTGMMEGWRWVLLGIPPETLPLIVSLGVTALLVPLAWRLFSIFEAVMADEI